MIRQDLNDALKQSMLARDTIATSTLRLILAALKDRDIAARTKGQTEGINDDEVLDLLGTMVKQRKESIELYEQGCRMELAERERSEMAVISRFLPAQLDEAETKRAIVDVIGETGASTIKDIGRTMAELRNRYRGRMDFAVAGAIVKEHLS